MNQKHQSHRHAFTLIELFIVLVIIGLIVGGVLVGTDLVEAVKKRHVIKELQDIDILYTQFKAKYGCLPADCTKATQFLGTNSIWNGNGNYQIKDGASTIGGHSEFTQVWRQLGLAFPQLGDFSGVFPDWNATGHQFMYEGTERNAMPSRFRNQVGYLIFHTSFHNNYKYSNGHIALLTSNFNNSVDWWAGVLTTNQAIDIDTKIDDGKPGGGRISPVCSSNASGQYYGTPCTNNWPLDASTQYTPSNLDIVMLAYKLD